MRRRLAETEFELRALGTAKEQTESKLRSLVKKNESLLGEVDRLGAELEHAKEETRARAQQAERGK